MEKISTRKYQGHKIQVSEKEITESMPANSRHCMIAEAVKRCIPDSKTVAVDIATIRFTDKKTGIRYTYQTPYNAQKALVQFDAGQKPQPFDFTLRTLYQMREKNVIRNKTPTPRKSAIAIPSNGEVGAERGGSAPVKINGQPVPRAPLGSIRRFGHHFIPRDETGAFNTTTLSTQQPQIVA